MDGFIQCFEEEREKHRKLVESSPKIKKGEFNICRKILGKPDCYKKRTIIIVK